MKDKIYPAFYRSADGYDYLYLDAKNYYDFSNAEWSEADHIGAVDHENDINITHEYLANTYGELASPEHAEFIIELGKNESNEISVELSTEYSKGSFFNFYTGPNGELYLSFFDRHIASDSGEKQITIPLPPKADKQESSEWPQVGDEVTLVSMGMAMYNKPVRLTYIGDGVGCYIDLTNNMEYTYAKRETVFKKPKTPEDELRDELSESFCAVGYETEKYIDYLMSKYNITKKPQ